MIVQQITKMSNNAVNLGVNAYNAAQQAVVEEKAKGLISLIVSSQKSLKDYDGFIKLEQESLQKLADDAVTQSSVIGTQWTGELNPNQVTIVNAIKKLNDDKQDQVKLLSQKHINKIEGYRSTVKGINETIADLRKQLNELGVSAVTVESVIAAQ